MVVGDLILRRLVRMLVGIRDRHLVVMEVKIEWNSICIMQTAV